MNLISSYTQVLISFPFYFFTSALTRVGITAPQSPTPPLTTISQLAYALGPDNIPHTTEIDTIPCAGVHIPHGALTGLLAWRLVVRLISSTKEKRRWNSYDNTNRANNYYTPPVHKSLQTHTGALVPFNPSASMSALSLPLFPQSAAGSRNDFTPKLRPYSVILPKQTQSSKPNLQTMVYQSQPQLDQNSPSFPSALTVNFILDTSLPYSIISRDTLVALGYPPYLIPPPSVSHLESAPPAMVVLSIQNIPTRFRIARPNEASRLGVQFLHDAGVSVFFPKDGAGVGPVLYGKSFLFGTSP